MLSYAGFTLFTLFNLCDLYHSKLSHAVPVIHICKYHFDRTSSTKSLIGPRSIPSFLACTKIFQLSLRPFPCQNIQLFEEHITKLFQFLNWCLLMPIDSKKIGHNILFQSIQIYITVQFIVLDICGTKVTYFCLQYW